MERVVALDFDGVISDSAPEAFVVALRTYTEMSPDAALARRAATALDGGAPPPARLRSHPLYAAFVEHMPLGNRAEDFGVVLAALEAEHPLPDQAAYDAFKAGLDPGWLRAFHQRFYRIRTALSEGDPAGWHALMGPYPPLLALLRRRAGDALLAIASAKDRRSVRLLLSAYGIADLFPEDRVLDKETGVTKDVHLRHLRDRLGVPFSRMTFVDDKVNHLDVVAPLGVRCALAAWGYNGAREAAIARARGYRVVALADAEAELFEAPPASSSRTEPEASTEKRATSSGGFQKTTG